MDALEELGYSWLFSRAVRIVRDNQTPLILTNMTVRVASGILVIMNELQNGHAVGLATAAATLLGVGVYPLLFSLIGLLYLIQSLDFKDSRWFRGCITIARLTALVSILLLVGGTCLRYSVDTDSSASTIGANLAKAGAVVAVSILFGCLGVMAACWSLRVALSKTSLTASYLYQSSRAGDC